MDSMVRARSGTATARLEGVDAARWLLCFPVAFLHSLPRPDVGHPPLLAALIGIACRGAVPFFFVASGYFARAGSPAEPVKRLGPAYAAWLILYSLADRRPGQLLHLHSWLTGGSAMHLWFSPALIVALAVVPNLVERLGAGRAAFLCLVSAGASLAFDGYRAVLHLPAIGGTRLMMAPLMVYVGVLFRRKGVSASPAVALIVFALACVIAAGEERAIAKLAGVPLVSHAYVLATLAMGPALFLWAKGVTRAPAWAARLGQISLGVYAAHLLFVRWFAAALREGGLAVDIAIGIAAVLAATLLSLILARMPATRWLVAPGQARVRPGARRLRALPTRAPASYRPL